MKYSADEEKGCSNCKHKAEALGYGSCRACRYSGLPNWEPQDDPDVTVDGEEELS